ncbi:MAG: hypothetical protein HC897_14030 [Thermoanaerobaculia bacterium]|nr:hypothetical protein [Thermoanaerobaculia bacterium]
MKDRQESWGGLCRSLVDALIEVIGAEWAVLAEEWRRWGKHVMVLAALASIVFTLLFCLLSLGVVLTVVLFELWLGAWWKAVLATLGSTLLAVIVLALVGWFLAGARAARSHRRASVGKITSGGGAIRFWWRRNPSRTATLRRNDERKSHAATRRQRHDNDSTTTCNDGEVVTMSQERKAPSRAMLRLEESRRRVERELGQLQRALQSEIGWAPTLKTWGLPLIGLAAGVAFALALPKLRRRKGLPSPR